MFWEDRDRLAPPVVFIITFLNPWFLSNLFYQWKFDMSILDQEVFCLSLSCFSDDVRFALCAILVYVINFLLRLIFFSFKCLLRTSCRVPCALISSESLCYWAVVTVSAVSALMITGARADPGPVPSVDSFHRSHLCPIWAWGTPVSLTWERTTRGRRERGNMCVRDTERRSSCSVKRMNRFYVQSVRNMSTNYTKYSRYNRQCDNARWGNLECEISISFACHGVMNILFRFGKTLCEREIER